MLVRRFLSIFATALIFAFSLTGCSLFGSDSDAADCQMSDSWGPVPSEFVGDKLAQKMGVSIDQLRGAEIGGAVCTKAVSVARIQDGSAALVSVEGKGSICTAVGTQDDPTTITMTKKILAVCIPDSSSV